MCAICKEDILARLTIKEIKQAGYELMNTAKTVDEFHHVMERLMELEREHEAEDDE